MLMAVGASPITIGSVAGIGVVEKDDQILVADPSGNGQVVVRVSSVTIQSSAFPLVAIGSPITVDGVNYTVRERLAMGDGGLTKLLLGTL